MNVVPYPLGYCTFYSDEWFFKINNFKGLAFEPFSYKDVCLALVCVFGKMLLLLSFVTSRDLGPSAYLLYVFLGVFQHFPNVGLVHILHGSFVHNYIILLELELAQTSKGLNPLLSPNDFLYPPHNFSLILLSLKKTVVLGWLCALLAWIHLLKPELLKLHLRNPCALCAEFHCSSSAPSWKFFHRT